MGVRNVIRNLVENGLYYLTEHAILEAGEESISIYDVEEILLKGYIRRTWTRERKYEIIGIMEDREIGVVCRITASRKVRVITVYKDEPKYEK